MEKESCFGLDITPSLGPVWDENFYKMAVVTLQQRIPAGPLNNVRAGVNSNIKRKKGREGEEGRRGGVTHGRGREGEEGGKGGGVTHGRGGDGEEGGIGGVTHGRSGGKRFVLIGGAGNDLHGTSFRFCRHRSAAATAANAAATAANAAAAGNKR